MANNTLRRGRPPGAGNRRLAREAIAAFVDGNAGRMQAWLDHVAEGVQRTDPDGNPVRDAAGAVQWVSPPNPVKAFEMYQAIIEYHVPKLARREIVGGDGGPVEMAVDLRGLSDEELSSMQALLAKAAVAQETDDAA